MGWDLSRLDVKEEKQLRIWTAIKGQGCLTRVTASQRQWPWPQRDINPLCCSFNSAITGQDHGRQSWSHFSHCRASQIHQSPDWRPTVNRRIRKKQKKNIPETEHKRQRRRTQQCWSMWLIHDKCYALDQTNYKFLIEPIISSLNRLLSKIYSNMPTEVCELWLKWRKVI